MDGKGVEEAFEILLEELDKIFSDLSEEEAKAYKDKDFEKAKQLISDGERIRNFRKSVESLQEEWLKDHFSQCQGQEKKEYHRKRRPKTQVKEYYIPILETLVELGGSAKSKVILERVYQKVQNVLTDFDIEKVPSGIEIRWRNIAGWARLAMIKEGLLSSDSPRGVWEITDKGREYLEQVRK